MASLMFSIASSSVSPCEWQPGKAGQLTLKPPSSRSGLKITLNNTVVSFHHEGKEVIRYDCAHDYAHKDCYNIKEQCRKINLYLDYEDALTLADDDINDNWEIYREKFLRGDFP